MNRVYSNDYNDCYIFNVLNLHHNICECILLFYKNCHSQKCIKFMEINPLNYAIVLEIKFINDMISKTNFP